MTPTLAFCHCVTAKGWQASAFTGCCAQARACSAQEMKQSCADSKQALKASGTHSIQLACPFHSKSKAKKAHSDEQTSEYSPSTFKLSKQHSYLEHSTLLI